jgi:Ca2+-binding RTX toxin-like protein
VTSIVGIIVLLVPVGARAGHEDDHPTCLGTAATLLGTTGDDLLRGTAGHDVISGLSGNDTVLGLGGDDYVCGGEGDDEVDAGAGLDYALGGWGRDVVLGGTDDDYTYGGRGVDVVMGQDGDDLVRGGHEDEEFLHEGDRIEGGDGDDLLLDGLGPDEMDGGPGSDTLAYGSDVAFIDLELDVATSEDDLVDAVPGIENVLGYLNSVGTGRNRGADPIIRGDLGSNILIGTWSRDRISGMGGEDLVDGLACDDRLEGGDGFDIASLHFVWDVTADLRSGQATGAPGCTAVIRRSSIQFDGMEGLLGGWGPDSLTGDDADNFLFGYYGRDELAGGRGDDYLDGSSQADFLMAGRGYDICIDGEMNFSCELDRGERPISEDMEEVDPWRLVNQFERILAMANRAHEIEGRET